MGNKERNFAYNMMTAAAFLLLFYLVGFLVILPFRLVLRVFLGYKFAFPSLLEGGCAGMMVCWLFYIYHRVPETYDYEIEGNSITWVYPPCRPFYMYSFHETYPVEGSVDGKNRKFIVKGLPTNVDYEYLGAHYRTTPELADEEFSLPGCHEAIIERPSPLSKSHILKVEQTNTNWTIGICVFGGLGFLAGVVRPAGS